MTKKKMTSDQKNLKLADIFYINSYSTNPRKYNIYIVSI